MVYSVIISVIILYFSQCSGVIYKLNESEYSRMPALFQLDEYSSCLQEEGGEYCMLELTLHAGNNYTLMNMIREYSMYDVKHYNHSIINRGVCVRKTCRDFVDENKTADLTRTLEACLNDSIWREYGLEAKVSLMLYCDRNNESMEITTLDRIVMWTVLILVTLNIVGSCYEYFIDRNTEKGNKYILCFSIKQNWRFLTNADITHDVTNGKTRYLTLLHGTRSTFCVFIILAHAYLLVAAGFTSNSLDYEETYNYTLYHIIYNGMSIVQIFFFISGFLLVHNLQYIEQKRRLNLLDIPKVLLFRIARLWPVLMITLAVTVTWVRHVGSGPLWKLFVTGSLVADCQQYWWHTLLFISNYMPDNRYCIIATWHLSAEMQVFTICLVAYVLTSGRARRLTLVALLVAGSAAPAAHVLLRDLDAIVIMKPEFYRTLINPTYRFMHILGHNNLPSFVIGMFTAMVFCDWYNKGCKISNGRLIRRVPYIAIAAIILIFYSGSVFYIEGAKFSVVYRMLYAAALRPAVGLACAVCGFISIRTTCGFRSMLEWRGWVAPSKLSYSVFLAHMLPVHMWLGARHTLTTMAYSNVALFHAMITIVSFIIAVPIHLLVEAPFDRILRLVKDHFWDSSAAATSKELVNKIE